MRKGEFMTWLNVAFEMPCWKQLCCSIFLWKLWYTTNQKLEVVFLNSTFIMQGHFELIKCDSKDIYNVIHSPIW